MKEIRITAAMVKRTKELLRLPKTHGNCRQVHICPECKKVQAHDFVPYGLGQGVLIDECYDRIISSNWRGILVAEKSRTGRNKYYIKKAPRVKQDAFTLTN